MHVDRVRYTQCLWRRIHRETGLTENIAHFSHPHESNLLQNTLAEKPQWTFWTSSGNRLSQSYINVSPLSPAQHGKLTFISHSFISWKSAVNVVDGFESVNVLTVRDVSSQLLVIHSILIWFHSYFSPRPLLSSLSVLPHFFLIDVQVTKWP